jgi:hypothetical protein
MPAQSGSSAVLERMHRGYTREAYLDLVARIKSLIPGIFPERGISNKKNVRFQVTSFLVFVEKQNKIMQRL